MICMISWDVLGIFFIYTAVILWAGLCWGYDMGKKDRK